MEHVHALYPTNNIFYHVIREVFIGIFLNFKGMAFCNRAA